MLTGVQRIREGVREGFENTISGTDLIVGARTGPVQLLLYSVFHIGDPTNNMSWSSFKELAEHPEVSWAVPVSLGDSHRGRRVIGTSLDFFEHFRYGRGKSLTFSKGNMFSDTYDVVVGADVAEKFDYSPGEKIILSHGVSEVSFQNHADSPFSVSGVLNRTGTPVDRSLYVRLEGLEAIHQGWEGGPPPSEPVHHRQEGEPVASDLEPEAVTAVLVGLQSKLGIFHFQRSVNNYEAEPLSALMPGITLRELWKVIGFAEAAMIVVALFVALAGVLGMLSSLLTTLQERRRELAIIRSLGGTPFDIFLLLLSEALILSLGGCLLGLALMYTALWLLQPVALSALGLHLPVNLPGILDLLMVGAVLLLAVVFGCIPGIKAYRQSLSDGLTIRI